jgi:hypothetical protein
MNSNFALGFVRISGFGFGILISDCLEYDFKS